MVLAAIPPPRYACLFRFCWCRRAVCECPPRPRARPARRRGSLIANAVAASRPTRSGTRPPASLATAGGGEAGTARGGQPAWSLRRWAPDVAYFAARSTCRPQAHFFLLRTRQASPSTRGRAGYAPRGALAPPGPPHPTSARCGGQLFRRPSSWRWGGRGRRPPHPRRGVGPRPGWALCPTSLSSSTG